jgi:hypothetical protein
VRGNTEPPNEDEVIENAAAENAAEMATKEDVKEEKSTSSAAGDPGDPNDPLTVTNSGGRWPRDGGSRRGSNLPVTFGRTIYESIWHQHRQPQQWDNPADGSLRKKVNPTKWAGVIKPGDWSAIGDNGEYTCPIRQSSPFALFLSEGRINVYRDALFETRESFYLCLWAMKIDRARWDAAEHWIALDDYSWSVYSAHFEISTSARDAVRGSGRRGASSPA